jgi:hypothetical protein
MLAELRKVDLATILRKRFHDLPLSAFAAATGPRRDYARV